METQILTVNITNYNITKACSINLPTDVTGGVYASITIQNSTIESFYMDYKQDTIEKIKYVYKITDSTIKKVPGDCLHAGKGTIEITNKKTNTKLTDCSLKTYTYSVEQTPKNYKHTTNPIYKDRTETRISYT